MEQYRHIGEVLGSLKALMVLRDEIQINQRQCSLILDIFSLAFDTIADEIRQNLKLEERSTKWKPLEFPLKELCRVFKEGELYIKNCLDSKEWCGKAMTLSQNNDCVEFHVHNLLCYFPAVIEAIENAGEVSGLDEDEKEKKKVMVSRKYDMEWNDPKLFQWRFGKQYLVPREICKQLESAWREDRWRLIESLKEKRDSKNKINFTKNEQRFADMLLKNLLSGSDKTCKELSPVSVLLGAKDYQVRRRLGKGKEYKEIMWLGQSFALRYFFGERQAHEAEISTLLSLSHPNILQYLCGFYDDEKKEFNLVMELMSKDLWSYMKENSSPRRQILFSIPVVVDLMLQIARGMEYLHSKKIYHGDLHPCNILLKARNSQEGYFLAKVSGFGLSSSRNNRDATQNTPTHNPISEELNPAIWYAPEVLSEMEQKGNNAFAFSSTSYKYTEKADAYSFGMICFELLTGKVPFEDNHLQGERTYQKIKAGERPLFPYSSPKYIVSLIKKCWQTEPSQRPNFSSICRILRYTKKLLSTNTEYYMINPELNQLELQSPPVECCDIEAMFLKGLPMESAPNYTSEVSQIPYEMFAYKIMEKGKISLMNTIKDKNSEPIKDELSVRTKEENEEQNILSVCRDDNNFDDVSTMEDPFPLIPYSKSVSGDAQSISPEAPPKKHVRIQIPSTKQDKPKKDQGRGKLQTAKSLPTRPSRVNKVNLPLHATTPLSPGRRRSITNVRESDRNNSKIIREGQSPSRTFPLSLTRRKKFEAHVSDSKPILKPILKFKQNQRTMNSPLMSPGRLQRHDSTSSLMQRKLLSSSSSCRKRSCGNVPDLDKVTRGTLSPLALSPFHPYMMRRGITKTRTSGHSSDSEDSCSKTKRESMSPFAMSPLSPYTTRRTCGHISD